MAQTTKIPIPKTFEASERRALATEIIDFIVNRTKGGKDKNNQDFEDYSDSYINSIEFKASGKSPGQVNLTLTGDMLGSLGLVSHKPGELEIGFRDGSFADKKADWNINGRVERDFLGITQNDLDNIVRPFRKEREKRLETAQRLLEVIDVEGRINFDRT